MVQRVIKYFQREFNSMHQAALLLGFSALLAQILALFRDRLFASSFGAGSTLDVYYAAFKVPDFIYVSIASFVSVTVLIPFIVEKGAHDKEGELRPFLNSIMSLFLTTMLFICTIAFFIIPGLVDFIVPGFTPEQADTFVLLSRIMLLQPIFLGLSNLYGSVTQAYKKFLIYALSPILYNAGIIFGILVLYPIYGMTGLVYGVIFGAALHFAIQIPVVFEKKLVPKLTTSIRWKEAKDVLTLSLPRTIALSAHSIALIVLISLASKITDGSIAIFTFSYNLQSVPLTIIGVSYSVAAFPSLTRLFTNGEHRAFVNQVVSAGRHIVFWSLPVISLFVVLRAQIVRTILGAGEFSWTDTRLTAAALALFSISVFAQSLILLFVRGYYAAGKTLKPLVINVLSSLIIIVLSYSLIRIFDMYPQFRYFLEALFRVEDIPGNTVLMLPLAFSIGVLLNLVALWGSFRRDFREYYSSLRKVAFQSLGAAVIMGFVSHQSLKVLDNYFDLDTFHGIFLQGFIAGTLGVVAGIILLLLLKNREIKEIMASLSARFWKQKPVLPGPEEHG